MLTTTLRDYHHVQLDDNYQFLIDTFAKTEAEIINEWLRSNRPQDLKAWTDDLVSFVPHRLYLAFKIKDEPQIVGRKDFH